MKTTIAVVLLCIAGVGGCASKSLAPFVGEWSLTVPGEACEPDAWMPGIDIDADGTFHLHDNIKAKAFPTTGGRVIVQDATKALLRVVDSESCKMPEGMTFTLMWLGPDRLEIAYDATGEKAILLRRQPEPAAGKAP